MSERKPKFRVETGEIVHLRNCYAKDLRRETEASETIRDSMRKIIAVFDEVLEHRTLEARKARP